jgi:hypothetical protein
MSPFNNIVEHQRFASYLAYADNKPPSSTVSDDGRFVTYKSKTMEIDRWILGLRKLYDDTRAGINDLCHHQAIPINIPDIVADDMTVSDRGYSWLDNGQFVRPRALLEILINQLGDELCVSTPGGLVFNPATMLRFMGKAGLLQDDLAVLCDCLPGQSSRATEFIESKIRNSNRPRNFFKHHGSDWLIIRRLKTENLVRKEVFIPKKIPPELQELLDFYLLVIRTVEIDFAYKLWGIEAAALYHEFLFVQSGKRTTAGQHSQNFVNKSGLYFGTELNVRQYRQMEIAIAKAYLGSEYELYEEDMNEEEEDAIAAQSGHGPRTRRTQYALEHGMLPSLTTDLLLRFGHVSEWWWRLVRFYPGAGPLLPLGRRRKIREDARQEGMLQLTAPGLQSEAVPGPSVSGGGFDTGRLVEMLTGTITTSVNQLKIELQDQIQASVAAGIAEAFIHQGVKPAAMAALPGPAIQPVPHGIPMNPIIPTTPPANPTMSPMPAAVDDDWSPEGLRGLYTPSPPPPPPPQPQPSSENDLALKLLRQLCPGADFKTPQQRMMVERSLTRERSFFGVLPTGGGKSMVWLIPAISEETGITLVVIPNKALLNDMLRKTQDMGISCCKWTAGHRHIGQSRIVYLAIESITSLAFRE